MNLEEHKKELMKNPEFKEGYESLEFEYKIRAAFQRINWQQVCYQIAAACIAVVLLAVFVSVILVGLTE